ncbi:unnamed protein product [Prorocentrum cordatum]|uniref:Uncharacterized protein n=1 Tax=Prorocentrum cordatum TaxID=2364126 RepID=A0ABN9QAD0_9DINO|nr:unnamed protein product [Polarella glacialis]
MSGAGGFGRHAVGEADIRQVDGGQLVGKTFGESSYTIYEACGPGQVEEPPYLVVWLHGADMGDMPKESASSPCRRACGTGCFSWCL